MPAFASLGLEDLNGIVAWPAAFDNLPGTLTSFDANGFEQGLLVNERAFGGAKSRHRLPKPQSGS